MGMDLAEWGGVEWVSEFCPVKGSSCVAVWQGAPFFAPVFLLAVGVAGGLPFSL